MVLIVGVLGLRHVKKSVPLGRALGYTLGCALGYALGYASTVQHNCAVQPYPTVPISTKIHILAITLTITLIVRIYQFKV